ncbi:MAG: MBL fold metallo-hydrolase [Muribaculaceae bacterium]
MPAKRQRRSSRSLYDLPLPSLFGDDVMPSDAGSDDDAVFEVVRKVVDEQRSKMAERAATGIEPMAAVERGEVLRFMSFGSGSSGNCAYLGTRSCGVLIDAGVDPKVVLDALHRCGIDVATIAGIILTHDHADHVRYAYNILRNHKHMRLYATLGAFKGILRRHNISRRIKDYHTPIFKETPFAVGELSITAFATSHDGSDNVGFSITGAGSTFVVMTDSGIITDRADYYLRRANDIMIESNYDRDMLLAGSYPEYLKQRILKDTGHLDNAVCADYVARIASQQLRNIFLCHLSEDNNTPEKALTATRLALTAKGFVVGDGSGSLDDRAAQLHLLALPRFDVTDLHLLR